MEVNQRVGVVNLTPVKISGQIERDYSKNQTTTTNDNIEFRCYSFLQYLTMAI